MTHIEFMAQMEQRIEDIWTADADDLEDRALARKIRRSLTKEQKTEAFRIGRIEFKSAGATRK